MSREQLRRRISILLVVFLIGLILSGLTAFPLTWEVRTLASWMGAMPADTPQMGSGLLSWIVRVRNALIDADARYPFLAYGTDWLAFGHIVIALAFIGPLRDPLRNRWVIEWGMIACVMVVPLAMICGPIRGIPVYWRLIDCSFGVFGILPLWLCRTYIVRLEAMSHKTI